MWALSASHFSLSDSIQAAFSGVAGGGGNGVAVLMIRSPSLIVCYQAGLAVTERRSALLLRVKSTALPLARPGGGRSFNPERVMLP